MPKSDLTSEHFLCHIYNGDLAAVRLLLDQGVPFDPKHHRSLLNTPLHMAASKGNLEILNLLLDRKASINRPDMFGNTALLWAAINVNLEIIRLLLNRGAVASIHHQNEYGRTPLLSAADEGSYEIVRLLLDKGAAIEHQDKNGNTPLLEATRGGHQKTVCLLLDRRAFIDRPNRQGDTALIEAARNNHLEIVYLLLDRGALIDHCNKQENTALIEAKNKGHSKVVEIIEEYKVYRELKKEIELFFLGKPLIKEEKPTCSYGCGVSSSIKSIFTKKKLIQPTFFLPNRIVEIIEEYPKPLNEPVPSNNLNK